MVQKVESPHTLVQQSGVKVNRSDSATKQMVTKDLLYKSTIYMSHCTKHGVLQYGKDS